MLYANFLLDPEDILKSKNKYGQYQVSGPKAIRLRN